MALLLLGLWPGTAWAHGVLRRSTPADGAHLSAAPRELRFTFSEPVELAVARIVLVGPDGEVALGALALHPDSATVLVAPIAGSLVAGVYGVRWQVAGPDGHPVRGDLGFVIAPGASGLEPASPAGPVAPGAAPPPPSHHESTALPTGPRFGAESPLYVVIRWLTYLTLAFVIGALAFRFAVLLPLARRADPDAASVLAPAASRAAQIGRLAAVALLVAAGMRLLAQSYALHGSGVLRPNLIGSMLTRTLWGWGWLLQLLGATLAWIGFRAVGRGGTDGGGASPVPRGWWIAAAAAALLALFPALSGHAASAPRLKLLTVLADAVHVVGAGGWIGGLALLLLAGVAASLRLEPAARGPAVAALVNAFSLTALGFAGALTLSGVFAAWIHLGSLPALWGSGYGRTLMVKLAVLSVVFGTGAYNWLKVRPALGDETGTRRLRRSASVEIGVGVLVLLITAVLVATGTP